MHALRSFATTCSLLVISLTLVARPSVAENKQPNIVLIYADDLGYGDLRLGNDGTVVGSILVLLTLMNRPRFLSRCQRHRTISLLFSRRVRGWLSSWVTDCLMRECLSLIHI